MAATLLKLATAAVALLKAAAAKLNSKENAAAVLVAATAEMLASCADTIDASAAVLDWARTGKIQVIIATAAMGRLE